MVSSCSELAVCTYTLLHNRRQLVCAHLCSLGYGETEASDRLLSMQAPMLYCGEHIGSANEPKVDIAVDPLDGTSLVAQGRDGAISVIAMAERGALFDPGPCMCASCLVLCLLHHDAAAQGCTWRRLPF